MQLADLLKLARGRGQRRSTTVQIEAALADLRQQREEANAAVRAAMAERQELLLSGDDAALDKIEAQAERGRRDLERLEAVERKLLEQLEHARSDDRQRALVALKERHDRAGETFATAARGALDALIAVRQVIADAGTQGFAAEAHHLFLPAPPILDAELIGRYELEISRLRDAQIPPPPKRQPPDSTPPNRVRLPQHSGLRTGGPTTNDCHDIKQTAPHSGLRAADVVESQRTGKPPKPPALLAPDPDALTFVKITRPLFDEQAGEGERRIRLFRSGYEHPRTGEQCVHGDVIALPTKVAYEVVRNNAGEYLEESK